MRAHRHAPALLAACLLAAVTCIAQQQPLPASPDAVKLLNGGASEEDRNRMEAQRSDFPLRIALSGHGGQYIVAPQLTLSSAAGKTIASVDNAGPYVMFNLPPGRYRADITLPGGGHEQRSFGVAGGQPEVLNWNFPAVQ